MTQQGILYGLGRFVKLQVSPSLPALVNVSLLRSEELWFMNGKYEKAAALFKEAHLPKRAAHCYKVDQQYEMAATTLRHGKLFDEYVDFFEKYVPSFSLRCWAFARPLEISDTYPIRTARD